MRIAVEGCAHGELDIIYETIQEMEKTNGKKIDLLICCGDFQSIRNLSDLHCMAVPDKYKDMCTFYKYYSGEKIAPVLTIFIGGNHEASNYLQELPYGGWVAPNIYYLGYANVITIGGIRIAGLSGIYKSQHWMQGHHEKPPYNENTIRSVYHIRNLEIFRLKQLTGNIDIFLSHDWPSGITKYGDENILLKGKPFFKNDIENNMLGSPPCMELLEHHYPNYWFSAHLHCKFAALVPEKEGTRITKFLALDKCLPKRKFLQVIEIKHNLDLPLKLHYDLEWLTILYLTNHLLSVKSGIHYMPGQYGNTRWIFTPTVEEKALVLKKFNYNLQIPLNFTQTVKPYNPDAIDISVEPPQLLVIIISFKLNPIVRSLSDEIILYIQILFNWSKIFYLYIKMKLIIINIMDKLTIISGTLFLAADVFAIVSLAMPDWIITDVGGDTRLGLMWSCMTLYNRPQVCYSPDLQPEWFMALVCIFVGCILITATIILLASSHWDRNVIPYARWVGFTAMVLFCLAAVIFPMGFHIDEIGGQPYQLPNSHQVGISYILFVLALWITVISELFAGKVCLPHF
ncbi:lariat debranching enzyme isoform X1 [Apis mellifera caucasica]|uniref:Lariat debranching enzyme isoform X1 n=2 Tax=Apinae TaxID=70987 RepID=A0A7M7GVS8_APIME|nr:lariat debranching enzyme isoform X1 [Apis mellifera]KAG6795983.1 lariat debranching enzyme isoform X1 [Apis mellifera caucasica]KAG9430434.1 lariat debranching enzyme isoform X1 [Apis mellifera carnica]|eukprot:XP_006566109.1 lariat debranching enzyme isoform X1 [Apis mellifera]